MSSSSRKRAAAIEALESYVPATSGVASRLSTIKIPAAPATATATKKLRRDPAMALARAHATAHEQTHSYRHAAAAAEGEGEEKAMEEKEEEEQVNDDDMYGMLEDDEGDDDAQLQALAHDFDRFSKLPNLSDVSTIKQTDEQIFAYWQEVKQRMDAFYTQLSLHFVKANVGIPKPPTLTREDRHSFLRAARIADGERPCIHGIECQSFRLGTKLGVPHPFACRELVIHQQQQQAPQMAGQLRQCIMCTDKVQTEMYYWNKAHLAPGEAAEYCQHYQVVVGPGQYAEQACLVSDTGRYLGLVAPIVGYSGDHYVPGEDGQSWVERGDLLYFH